MASQFNNEFNRLYAEKKKIQDSIWDAEEDNNIEELKKLTERLVVIKIMMKEEMEKMKGRARELAGKQKELEEEQKKEEIEKKKIEKQKKKIEELDKYYSDFEKQVTDAMSKNDYSDIFLSCSVPEQNFTLVVREKLCKIYAWQQRQRVRLEKLIQKQQAYATTKSDIAEKMKMQLDKLGPKYSLEEMQQAILKTIPDDEDDDYVRGQESESDDDMPIAIADDEGVMSEGYSYESPYEYIARLKQKKTQADEGSLRQLTVSMRQAHKLHEIVLTKLVTHDEDFKKLQNDHNKKTAVYMKELKEHKESVMHLKKLLSEYTEMHRIEQSQSENEEKLRKELEKMKEKLKEAQEISTKLPQTGSSKELELENTKLKTEISVLKKEIADTKLKIKAVDKLKEQVEDLEDELRDAKKNEKKAQSMLEKIEKDSKKKITEFEDEKAELIEKMKEKEEENESEIKKIMKERNRAQRKLEELEENAADKSELESIKKENEELLNKITQLNQALEEKTLENQKLAINHYNITENMERVHKEEVDEIKEKYVKPLQKILFENSKETIRAAEEAGKFRRRAEELEDELARIKKEWDRILEIKEHIAYKKGFNDARTKEIREIAVQTDVVNDDYLVVDKGYPEHVMEKALDAYWNFRNQERIRIMQDEGSIDGVNYISAHEQKLTAFLAEYRKQFPACQYVKWSEESVYDRYVKGSKYTGPIAGMMKDVDCIARIKYKWELRESEIEKSGLRELRQEAEEKLEEAKKTLANGILLQSRAPEKVTGREGNIEEFSNLLKEIDTWPDECFYKQMPNKFFSYHLSEWKVIYDSVFIGFNRKFYTCQISQLNREQSCTMFKLLVHLNLLTGSRSHIWYGNHLNRTFNEKDYSSGVGRKDKHEYLMNRAQNTFFDWYGDDARTCFNEMTLKLNSEGAEKYKILLKTIGSTFTARNFSFTVSC